MNLLVLAALTESTGNTTTARRISAHLSQQHHVTLVDVHKTNMGQLKDLVRAKNVDAAIGLHALLAGPYLHALNIPYALIMGGTDLYQELHPLQVKLMVRSVLAAGEIVAFGPENLNQAQELWPELKGKGTCIAQAIDITEIDRRYDIRRQLEISPQDNLVLLPAGIRAIKDPFHIAKEFHQYHLETGTHLCLVGPILEPEFAQENFKIIQELDGIHFIPGLPRPHMLAAIEQANILFNSSLSEGMSSAILEALTLRTPVVARVNDGNISIITHNTNGFLYQSPNEAIHFIDRLIKNPTLRENFNSAAQVYLKTRHTIEQEFAAYDHVIKSITTGQLRTSQYSTPERRTNLWQLN